MKIKKMFAWILAVLTITSLTACGEKPAVSGDDHSDWVWVQNINNYGAQSESGYYYVNYNTLHYFDFAAKASTVLCAKVGCSHGTESCDAYIKAIGAIPTFFYDDHLYYCPIGEGAIYSRNATGAELKKVGNMGTKYVKEQMSVQINSLAVADGYLFYEAGIQDSTLENNVTTIKTVMRCIGRLNLSTGKDEILIEEEPDKNNEMLNLCAVREKGILFSHREGTDVDRNDPNYAAALDAIPVTLVHWNAETGETKELFRKSREECINVNMVADGKVYFSAKFGQNTKPPKFDYNFTYSYDLNTGKEETVCPAYTRHLLGGAYALCRDIDGKFFVYNMSSGQQLPCTVEDAVYMVVTNVSDKGFVVRMEDIESEEKENARLCFYYISHGSLTDGLQETDFQYIYTF